jgi:hypothetical protein
MKPRPLWRWWLFCVALRLSWHTGWRWAANLMGWCVLPEWLASPEDLAHHERHVCDEHCPF